MAKRVCKLRLRYLAAGSNDTHGSRLLELDSPTGLGLGDDGTVYVLDKHHRVLRWKPGAASGTVPPAPATREQCEAALRRRQTCSTE